MPFLSVVFRTYTEARWDYLVASITSVQRQTRELGGRLAWSQGDDGDFTLVVRLPDR